MDRSQIRSAAATPPKPLRSRVVGGSYCAEPGLLASCCGQKYFTEIPTNRVA